MPDIVNRTFSYFLLITFYFAFTRSAGGQSLNNDEFRGVWIATVHNIDWPSAPGLPVDQQKKELSDLIDRIHKFNLNTVFLQVRPAGDAFYISKTEPWSYFLSGKQGKPPESFFDPLAYAIELCHKKGMELHAWFNPFRVRNNSKYDLAKSNFAVKNPQMVHEYDHKMFLDPGYPQVRAHVVKVIMEVVRNYDIDAVLMDDYFYPYPVSGKKFPDNKTFAKYGKVFYPGRLKDWRRNNINSFILTLHDSIKAVKPNLPLGISPFGVWRSSSDDPKGSPLLKGTTSYDHLYADVNKWLANDWIDYVIPQLYWEQGNRYGDFNALAKWWNEHSYGKPLYLGQALYRSTSASNRWRNPNEISDQINIMRKYDNIKGFALFSASHLARIPNPELKQLTALLAKPKMDLLAVEKMPVNEIFLASSSDTLRSHVIDENFFDPVINIMNQKEYQSNFVLPGTFNLKKNRKQWLISWNLTDTLIHKGKKYVLLTYKDHADTAHLQKIFILNNKEQISIPVAADFNPKKAFFTLAAIDEIKNERSISKLFKIKRNKVVYN